MFLGHFLYIQWRSTVHSYLGNNYFQVGNNTLHARGCHGLILALQYALVFMQPLYTHCWKDPELCPFGVSKPLSFYIKYP
jgi:hypothetical protein